MIGNLFTVFTSKLFLGLSGILLALLLVQTFRIEGMWCRDTKAGDKPQCVFNGFKQELGIIRIDLDEARARTEAEIAQHKATKLAYRNAQAEAEALEKERLTRVLEHQKEISNERSQSFERRIAAARADAERLRAQIGQSGASTRGSTSGVNLPQTGHTPGRTDGSAGDYGLSVEERLTATKQAIQLDELISWVQAQGKVN